MGRTSSVGTAGGKKQSSKADSSPDSTKNESSGGISISETSQVVSSAKKAIEALPDVRVGKVTETQLAIDDGSYAVESQKLAKHMVDESLRESVRLDANAKT